MTRVARDAPRGASPPARILLTQSHATSRGTHVAGAALAMIVVSKLFPSRAGDDAGAAYPGLELLATAVLMLDADASRDLREPGRGKPVRAVAKKHLVGHRAATSLRRRAGR